MTLPAAARRFEGRVALVTGGAGGIGSAVASRLAAEGAHVSVADLFLEGAEQVVAQIRDAGGHASAHPLDVCRAAHVERVLDEIEKSVGVVDVLVTGAGIVKNQPFLDLSPDDWDRTLEINLKGTFLAIQAVGRRLVAAGRPGRMVAISSISGRGARPDSSDYAASKAGVISLVRSAAVAFAAHGINVNAVCPGIVEDRMTLAVHRARAAMAGITPEESLAAMVATIPLGRIETADDVAGAITYLLSDDASYVTGQTLNVCGGMEFD